jgi:hypothetical protein
VSQSNAQNPLADINNMVLLPTAHSILAVGTDASFGDASCALYSLATSSWALTGRLGVNRTNFDLTALPDGTALVAGGIAPSSQAALTSSELYSPASGKWSAAGNLTTGRANAVATLLLGGQVLVAGGQDSGGNSLASAELYSAMTKTWGTANSMATARVYHQLLTLPGGSALVIGGDDPVTVRACLFWLRMLCEPLPEHAAVSLTAPMHPTRCLPQ